MKKFLLILYFASISLCLKAQNNIVTISQAYGSRSERTHYTVAHKQFGTDYITTYKFGNYTITAENQKGNNYIIVNIKTPGIIGANDNVTIPYSKCDGYVMYKGGASNVLGSNKLEYLVSFRSTDKNFVAVNQVMDTETERYHYSLEPLNQQLYTLSKKIWINCTNNTQTTQNTPANAVQNRSSFNSLRSLKGKYTQQVNFFNNPIVKNELSRLMQNDYSRFKNKFLNTAAGVSIEVNNDVLNVHTFQPHWARDQAILFMDLQTQTSFLYWVDDNKAQIYGQTPITPNMLAFIQEKLKDSKYISPDHQAVLKNIAEKFGVQEITPTVETSNNLSTTPSDIPTSVEVPARFEGGDEAFAKFLSANIKYPSEAIRKKTTGIVWIYFIIDENGSVTNAKIGRGIGDGCDEEALRVIKLSPNWHPAQIKNRPVKFQINMPINFSI